MRVARSRRCCFATASAAMATSGAICVRTSLIASRSILITVVMDVPLRRAIRVA